MNIKIVLLTVLSGVLMFVVIPILNLFIHETQNTYQLTNQVTHLKQTPTPQQKAVSLPYLQTHGETIVRKDTQTHVVLKGVVSDEFRFVDKDIAIDRLVNDIRTAKQWGANLFGFFVLPKLLDDTAIKKLDEAIEEATKLHMYVYIMPIINYPELDPRTHIDSSLNEFCQRVAHRYRNHTNILYGMGAEPFNIAENTWRDKQIELATIIRKENPSAPLLITGVDYGRNFRYTDKQDFPFDNTIYFLVDYLKETKESLSLDTQIDGYEFYPYDRNRAVIMGEFGGVWKSGFGSEEDMHVIHQYLKEMNVHSVSYTMYRNEPYEGKEFEGLGIRTISGNLTNRGKAIVEDLKNFPPTNFESPP
jgi:hypothetical protein